MVSGVAIQVPAAAHFYAAEPVREILAGAAANLDAQGAFGVEDYFSEDRLYRL